MVSKCNDSNNLSRLRLTSEEKALAAHMVYLCTKIMSYPVTFKHVESLKVVAALDLGAHLRKETDIPLKPLQSGAWMKVFEGTPMSINTGGSEEKGTIAIGFTIYDVNELVHKGDVSFGTTSKRQNCMQSSKHCYSWWHKVGSMQGITFI